MDIRLEAADGQAPPVDTFVSLRVGDVQKQSRFAKVRQFRFQDPGDGRGAFGRLEVFRRVGHLTVSFANVGDGELQQVEVPCSIPGMNTLKLGLAVTGGRTGQDKEMGKTARGRRDAAQKYLAEKRLEETLALAMREVVQIMPDDACGYLSSAILRLGGAADSAGIASQQDGEGRRVAPAAEEPLSTEVSPMPACHASKDDTLASERERRGDTDRSSVDTEARGTLQGVLVEACATGKLDMVLNDVHQRSPPPAAAEADDIDAVRENAQAILLSASRDGKLAEVLESVGRQPPQADGAVAAERGAEMRQPAAEAEAAEGGEGAGAAGPGADQDLDVIRDRAKKAFLDAGLNGKLEETLSSMSTSGELASTLALIERQPTSDPGPAKAGVPEATDFLREQVQATFSKACLSGELGQTLRTVKGARGAAARQDPAEPVDVVDKDDKAYTFAGPAFGAEQGAALVEPEEAAHRLGAEDPAPGPEQENEPEGPAGADGAAPLAEELVGPDPPPPEPQKDAEKMEETPLSILTRSHSCMVKMPPQEIITSFMQEIEKKDQEIEELEKQLEELNNE